MPTSMKLDDDPEIINKPDDNEGEDEGHESHTEPDSDSESGSSSDEDEENAPKKTRQKFEKIITDLRACAGSKEIKVGNYDLNDPTQLSNFFKAHEGYLSKKCTKDENLMHLIADQDKDKMPAPDTMAPLIDALVQLEANLLAQRDDNGKTPLFCAVANKNRRLVKVMCKAHTDINSILRIPKSATNVRSTNCVHQAISKKSAPRDDALIKFLIEHADADTLLALNEDGLTPLHLAVEYKRCDEGQIKVVETLVGRCDKALDKTYKHPKKGLLSPYLYLNYTYEQATQLDKTTGEGKTTKSKEEGSKSSYGGKEDSRNKRGEVSKDEQKNGPTAKVQISEQQRIIQRGSEAPAGKFTSHSSMPDRSRGPLAVVTSIENSSKVSPKSPAGKEKEGKSSSRKSKSSKLKPSRTSVEEIKKFLRLYCLRNRLHDDAVEFLYGVQQDKQIYFDLIGIAPKITRDWITNGLNYLTFEDILQYVAIPWVEIEKDIVEPKQGQRTAEINGNSRTDMKLLFDWLRDVKGVKRILKVIVEDLPHPAHSDEVIEYCLRGMCVETWDWKKLDLSPEVLHRVASDVQVVHLYWSGNNAILRAWSEPEGLKKLEKLRTVHLHTQQGLETRLRTKQNVKEFKARMAPIEVRDTKIKGGKTDSSSNGIAAIQDPYERHKWVTCMEEYAYFLQTAEHEWLEWRVQSSDKREQSQALQKPVIVALIDDGVDVNDQNVQSRIIGGRSFCHRDEEQNLNQPYYISGGGHGTAMAGLICKVCPNVKLFILRLDEYSIEPGKRQITAKSAAKAVRDATEKRVDIISMSWTIEKTDRNGNDIKELEDAITAAARENILMFCAATDQGAYRDRTYPAATSTKKIFKIGAAEASGAALKWLGDQTLVDFVFPGHQVVMEPHGDPRVKKYTALTGSSVATALASGLAAVILYTVQLAEVSQERGGLRGAYESLKNHDRMKEAFSQIGTTKESESKYITVWNRFANVVKQADSESQPKDRWIDYIGMLANDLMRKA
ncbi:hypothetical protein F5B22DRAFT_605779 [Xylaria bambusicola]|uniref:uncharacterized protein n=1 Tax=Xylaria bambusicola TaxID=326684 RepID=UPI002007CCCA|nr:uncharacterized protein F5B22DRAFT_605779 [Xylaria bambusicola]KAI0516989.1 hypothetical protein F5B22DRAFT_605779 [Xylaria bambusicola]